MRGRTLLLHAHLNPEAAVGGGPVAGAAGVTGRGPALGGVARIAAGAQAVETALAEIALFAERIDLRSGLVGRVVIRAPLPDQAVHVVKAPRIRFLLTDGLHQRAGVP